MTGSELRAQLRARQTRNKGVAQGVSGTPEVAYEVALPKDQVALQRSRVLENATPDQTAAPAVLQYRLNDGHGAGTLIDPSVCVAAVHELHWRFGGRVDWASRRSEMSGAHAHPAM
jgi:hypothetical protein